LNGAPDRHGSTAGSKNFGAAMVSGLELRLSRGVGADNSVEQELPMASSSAEDTIRNLMDKGTYDRLEKDLSKVKGDISALADQLSDALSTFTGSARKQARRGYRQAREQVDSMVSDASERGSAAMETAQDMASSLEETIEDAIQQRPIAAVGLAIGLGFLIGVTWRR
jgi:ElaB/YqjD/DUF883 family membrane-anchored ribosome-binding protein